MQHPSQLQEVKLFLQISGSALAGSTLELRTGGERLVVFVLRKPMHQELTTGQVVASVRTQLGLVRDRIETSSK